MRPPFQLGALRLLKIEIWLLVLIPDYEIIKPLGAIGSPSTVFAAVLFLVWLITWLSPSLHLARTCKPVRWGILAYLSASLLSYAVMNLHVVQRDQLQSADRYLIALIGAAGITLTAAEGLRSWQELLELLRSMVTAVAVLALFGILQFRPRFNIVNYLVKIPLLSTGADFGPLQQRGGFIRPTSTTLHPIEFGAILAITLAFALFLVSYDTARPLWRRVVPLALIVFAIPVSISRSAILVTVIVVISFAVSATSRQRRILAAGAGILVVAVFGLIPHLLGTIKGYIFAGTSDSSISHRTNDYAYAAPFLRHAPWLGRGPGTFLPIDFPHVLDNQYLHSLIEIGIIGTVCLLALFLMPLFLGRGARLRARTRQARMLGNLIAGAGLGATLVAATFDSLSFPTFTAFDALLLGIAGMYWSLAVSARPGGTALRRLPTRGWAERHTASGR